MQWAPKQNNEIPYGISEYMHQEKLRQSENPEKH